MGIYADRAVLVRIACQNCGQEFLVGEDQSALDRMKLRWMFPGNEVDDEVASWVDGYHYGDPPRHECVGDTMNCEDLEILEVWMQNEGTDYAWVRVSNLEGVINDEETPQIKEDPTPSDAGPSGGSSP